MILVTGATGRTGSFVVRELQARGKTVRALARSESAQRAEALGAEVVLGDLDDPGSLRRAAKGVTGIVHAATTYKRPEIDIAATGALADAWDRGPFVYISSTSVYGNDTHSVLVTEDHPLDENEDYQRGKVRSEAMLRQIAQARRRSDFTILRPPFIMGPHPRDYDRWVTNGGPVEAGDAIRQNEPVVLPGESKREWSQYRDAWVDTRELAWVIAECLDRPLGGVANVISGHFGWHDLIAEVIQLTGSKSTIEHKPVDQLSNMKFFAQTWRFSSERLQDHLGYEPAYRWQDTLAEIVALGSLQPVGHAS